MLKFTRQHMELAYDSKVVAVYKDYLITPGGDTVVYDYIRHKNGGGAGALLVDKDENTYLVKLYRNSIDSLSLEIPAGGYLYAGESGEECAAREANEETGYIPGHMYHVTNMVSAIGTFDERTDVYIGTDLRKGCVKPDPDEYIEVISMPVDKAVEYITTGKITDSKTIVALLAYKYMKSRGIIEL